MRKTKRVRSRSCNGGSFDDFLKEQGIFEAVQATALKRTFATQIAKAIRERNLTKAAVARRMHTSQVQLERFLDPDYHSVTLATLCRAASAVGGELYISLTVGMED
jgi:antitoxin HicB